jgi:hypothetical protein
MALVLSFGQPLTDILMEDDSLSITGEHDPPWRFMPLMSVNATDGFLARPTCPSPILHMW